MAIQLLGESVGEVGDERRITLGFRRFLLDKRTASRRMRCASLDFCLVL